MSETMPLYTLCKEDLESMDREVSPSAAGCRRARGPHAFLLETRRPQWHTCRQPWAASTRGHPGHPQDALGARALRRRLAPGRLAFSSMRGCCWHHVGGYQGCLGCG